MRFLIVLFVVGFAAQTFAQESTAGGSLSTEASWTALRNMLTRTDGNVAILRTDVDAMKACAAQLKVWDPAKGCVNIDTSLYDKMLACADAGKLYDKSSNACVEPSVTVKAPTCSLTSVTKSSSSRGSSASTSCPAGSYMDIISSQTDDCPGSTYPCTKTKYNCTSVVCK